MEEKHTTIEHPQDLLPGYALGCLDSEDAALVTVHLKECDRCRTELRLHEETVAELAFSAPQANSAALRLKRPAANPSAPSWFSALLSGWPRLFPVATLAAFVLVAALSLTTLLLWQKSLDKNVLVRVPLAATTIVPAASGALILPPQGKNAILEVAGLEALGDEHQYQLWLIRDGKRTSGGTFSVDASGKASLNVPSPLPFRSYDAFGITIEPYGGSPGPTGPKVLGGRLPS